MVKKYLYPGLIVLAVLIITGTLISKCARNSKGGKHEQVRLDIVNYDLVKSEVAKKYRDSILSLNKALQIALSRKEIEYIPIRIKADSAVKEYVKQPTLARCDDAILLLRVQNTKADSIIGDLKQIGANKDTVIASFGRTVAQKDNTISEFNAAFMDLQEDYKQALKPKRFGLGIQAGYGVGKSIMPTPYIGIGISYNFIRL